MMQEASLAPSHDFIQRSRQTSFLSVARGVPGLVGSLNRLFGQAHEPLNEDSKIAYEDIASRLSASA